MLMAMGAQASEPVSFESVAPVASSEAVVPVAVDTVLAMPVAVPAAVEVRSLDQQRLSVAPKPKKALLSRSVRKQLVVLAAAAPAKTVETSAAKSVFHWFFDHEEEGDAADDLDMHVAYARPQPVKQKQVDADGEDGEHGEVSDHAKVRLMVARMRALEAHQKRFG